MGDARRLGSASISFCREGELKREKKGEIKRVNGTALEGNCILVGPLEARLLYAEVERILPGIADAR